MTIVMTGGGSGGHVTPLIAVAAELKKQHPDSKIIFIGQRGDRFGTVVADCEYIDESKRIFAGKFRRYHGAGWRQLLDIKTMLLNVRDFFYFLIGLMQSLWIMRRLSPNVVFIKGGFVGVPVGLASAFWRLPYVTHDSDAIAGLANRIIARWARLHAVALPELLYKGYPPEKTVRTGVPIAAEYEPITAKLKQSYRESIGVPIDAELLFVTGGGLGSLVINQAILQIAPELLQKRPHLWIVHATGQAHEASVGHAYKAVLPESSYNRVQTFAFTNKLHEYSGASDVVVARAGATNIAEFAAQGIATIMVPSPFLAGGHQLKNAEGLAEQKAARLIEEDTLRKNPSSLGDIVEELLSDSAQRMQLAKALGKMANHRAAHDLSVLLLEIAAQAE